MEQNGRILVVEDNDFVRMQICRFLGDSGFEAIESTDGEHAMNVLDDDIDLAIVDVRMEPVDGFEFIRTMRNNNNQTPVFLVTGDNNSDLLSEATKLGVGAVFKKPVQKERLIKMLSRALQIEKH